MTHLVRHVKSTTRRIWCVINYLIKNEVPSLQGVTVTIVVYFLVATFYSLVCNFMGRELDRVQRFMVVTVKGLTLV